MFKKKNDELNIEKINDSVSLLNKILRIMFVLIIIIGVYLGIKLIQELKIKDIIIDILKIIAPVFIGLFVAWLFDPLVKKMQRKGIKRGIGAIIVYIVFISLLIILIAAIIPILTEQINDFVKTIPSIFTIITDWLKDITKGINIEGIDINNFTTEVTNKLGSFATSLAQSLPNLTVNFLKSFFSGILTFVIGLIIGFYFLIGFDNAGELIITLFPKNIQKDTRELTNEVNNSFRRFVEGALLDATFVFIITSIAFAIVGLKAPLLFGLFCGITNVIPYAGPYIGGAPAVIVGFSQGPLTGVLTLLSVVVIQFLEGNFLQPVIMSKTTKLHPVTIITGLLIFGHFFGIIGMVISTPIIAAVKSIFMFFNEKYEIINL